MNILIIDGPGVHPTSAARALGGGLHRKGHGVIVHPVRLQDLGWIPRVGIEKRVSKILDIHHPDVIHVFSPTVSTTTSTPRLAVCLRTAWPTSSAV